MRRCDHWPLLYRLVVQLAFQSFVVGDLPDSLHEVLLNDVLALGPDGKQSSFGAHVTQIGPVEVVGQFDHCLVVDVTVLGNWTGMDLQDFQSRSMKNEQLMLENECKSDATYLACSLGSGISIFLSKRPGRNKAGSNVSGRLVAIIILTWPNESKPSIWFSSSIRVR